MNYREKIFARTETNRFLVNEKRGGGAVGSGLLMTLLRTLANSHVKFIYCKWGGSLVPDRSGPGFEFEDPEHIFLCIMQ